MFKTQEGPSSKGWCCRGCSFFEIEYWHEPSGDGETYDSGCYAWCLAMDRKSMGAYHYDHTTTPDWCPYLVDAKD